MFRLVVHRDQLAAEDELDVDQLHVEFGIVRCAAGTSVTIRALLVLQRAVRVEIVDRRDAQDAALVVERIVLAAARVDVLPHFLTADTDFPHPEFGHVVVSISASSVPRCVRGDDLRSAARA